MAIASGLRKTKVSAQGLGGTPVAAVRKTHVLVQEDRVDGELLDDGVRSVSRSVIDNNDLFWSEGVLHQRLETVSNVGFTLMGYNYDGGVGFLIQLQSQAPATGLYRSKPNWIT